MHQPVRLLVVDGLTLMRTALASLLNRRRGLRVVAEAGDAAGALQQAMVNKPDVILLEPSVAGGGPDLVVGLQSQVPEASILVLSRTGGPVSQFLDAGARGYLGGDCSVEQLVVAIREVDAGNLVVAPGAIGASLENLGAQRSAGALAILTGRETDVTRLVVQGCSNGEIARRLTITEHTVKGHLGNILAKLGLENRTQVAAYALAQGLGKPPNSAC